MYRMASAFSPLVLAAVGGTVTAFARQIALEVPALKRTRQLALPNADRHEDRRVVIAAARTYDDDPFPLRWTPRCFLVHVSRVAAFALET